MPKRVRKAPAAAITLPTGFRYQRDFVSPAEERELIAHLERLDFQPFDFHGYTARRRIVEYGWEYDFGSRKASTAPPIADFLLPLRERAAAFAGFTGAEALVEAVATEYPTGAPIGWHRGVPQVEAIL